MSFRSRTRSIGAFYIPGFPKGVKWLLISNVAIFVIGFFAQLARLDRPLAYLALRPVDVVKYFSVWQLFTYAFLHGGFGHIIWNMLALWMFGADIERIWGTRRFLQFYFFCAVGAGICVVIAELPSALGQSERRHYWKLRRYLRHSAGLRHHVPGSRNPVGIPDSDQGEVLRHDHWRGGVL